MDLTDAWLYCNTYLRISSKSRSRYSTMREAGTGIGDYYRFYNQNRWRQSMEYKTPQEVLMADNRRGGARFRFRVRVRRTLRVRPHPIPNARTILLDAGPLALPILRVALRCCDKREEIRNLIKEIEGMSGPRL